MIYTHLTPTELVMIEAYFNQMHSVSKVAKRLQRSRQTIYNVYRFLKNGGNAMSYYKQYKKNKSNCGRRPIVLPDEQQEYIQKKVVQGWAPDVLIGRAEFPIACSVRTLYR
ncbi:transposase, partial [Enterococcus italicus]